MPEKEQPEKYSFFGEPNTSIFNLDLLRNYRRKWLFGDLTAGLAIFATTIPAALAYGELAGLKHVNGLYASLLAMGIYAIFGSSRQLIIDAEAAVAILVSTSVAHVYSGGNPSIFAAMVFMQAILVGVIQTLAGVFRAGFLSDFIPRSVVNGFINGVALIIILSQLGKFTGIQLKNEEFFPRLWEMISKANETHLVTFLVGGACLLGMLVLRPLFRRLHLPEAVAVLILITLAVIWLDLGAQGVKLVGKVPAGLPHPELPNVGLKDIFMMFPVALGVALVSFVDTTITGRAFAYSGGYHLDPNQELISLGMCNIGTGFFQGFAVGSSHSRTALNDMYGGRTQLAQLLAAILLAIFLLYFTFIVKDVPQVGLAGIIIIAGFHLLRPLEVATMWRTWRPSGYISIGTTCAVLIAGLPIGILVSVSLAFILVLHRLARPFETVSRPSKLPGTIVFRFAGPLYFFNIGYFSDRVRGLIESAIEGVKIVLINAEAVTDTDLDAVEYLNELHSSLKRHGIILGMFEVKGHFQEMLKDPRLPKPIDLLIYPSVEEAIKELTKEKDKEDKKELNS